MREMTEKGSKRLREIEGNQNKMRERGREREREGEQQKQGDSLEEVKKVESREIKHI